MPKIWVTEFDKVVTDAEGRAVLAGYLPFLKSKSYTVTTAIETDQLVPRTRMVRVKAENDADFHVKVGETGMSDATTEDMPVSTSEYFGVQEGVKKQHLSLVEA